MPRLLVTLLLVWVAFASPAPAGVSSRWDLQLLRDCQGDCSWAYATEPWDFNVCYACFCLIRSAETAGELESAVAQCRAELDRRRG